MSREPRPEVDDLDPLSRSVRLLVWSVGDLLAVLSPEGLLRETLRWSCRLALIIAIPLGLLAGILWLLHIICVMAMSILTAFLGAALMCAALVVASRLIR